MRPFEIIIPTLLAINLTWIRPRPYLVRVLPITALILVIIHFITEGYRWQMIPIYVIAAILGFTALVRFQLPVDMKPLASYLTLILLAVSTALPVLLPVPNIPAPSGPYSIGTRIIDLTDTSRREIYSGKDEPRRFMFQVWYPSEADPSAEQAPWMDPANIYAPAVAGFFQLPSFFLNHLALVKVPAYKNTPLANSDSKFPIILFSHGWQSFNAQNTGQALELASHGYVVVGVQHTYGAVITIFPDGTIAPNNPNALPSDDVPTEEYEMTAHILVKQWAGDLGYTLDYLDAQNKDPNSPFYNRLDLSRLGVYGHSTGGGAAIQFCGTDLRCKALLGLDPFMRPVSYEVIDAGTTQTSFFMFSQLWTDDVNSRNNELFHRYYPHVSNSLGVVSIEGTKHYDFTDLPLLSPIAPQLGLKGPINGKRVVTIVDDYLLSFFEMTLNGGPTTLFNNPSPYPEVKPRN